MFYLFITGCVTCCNCGPCRKANGLAPTHQVINLARASGFDNVHDYLVHGRTGETPAQLLERKRTFDWGRWLLCDFVPATPADSETDLRESEDDTSAACDGTDPFDDTPCLTCGGLDRPEDFVLCDGCDQGYHCYCVGLDAVPLDEWRCQICADEDGDDGAEAQPASTQEDETAARDEAMARGLQRERELGMAHYVEEVGDNSTFEGAKDFMNDKERPRSKL